MTIAERPNQDVAVPLDEGDGAALDLEPTRDEIRGKRRRVRATTLDDRLELAGSAGQSLGAFLTDGVVLGMAKFSRVLEVDLANRCAVVQPGVTNLAISAAVVSTAIAMPRRSEALPDSWGRR